MLPLATMPTPVGTPSKALHRQSQSEHSHQECDPQIEQIMATGPPYHHEVGQAPHPNSSIQYRLIHPPFPHLSLFLGCLYWLLFLGYYPMGQLSLRPLRRHILQHLRPSRRVPAKTNHLQGMAARAIPSGSLSAASHSCKKGRLFQSTHNLCWPHLSKEGSPQKLRHIQMVNANQTRLKAFCWLLHLTDYYAGGFFTHPP